MQPRHPASPAFLVTLAVLAALAHAVWAVTASVDKSMTADEIAHLTAGQAYNTRGDYRFQPENGNLPQRWTALPLTLGAAPLPPPTRATWKNADVWNYGHEFFFGHAVPADAWLFAGRAMIALFSAATGLMVFFWSRALFGWRGGFVSLALFGFSPAFLAHGALATSDVVMTFFFLAAVGAWWRHLEQPGPWWATVSATAFALAWVAKYSAVLLLPMLALIATVWLLEQGRRGNGNAAARRLLRSAALHGAAAWAGIWLFYGFRFSAFAPGLDEGARYYHGWPFLLTDLTGLKRSAVLAAQSWHLLPDAFLYGFTFVYQFSQQRAAFLNGNYSFEGWRSFFPYAFLVKSTPALLAFVVTGAVVVGRRLAQRRAADLWARGRPLVPLAVLFAVYWITSITSHLNIGHRHILPTYPVLFIGAGVFGRWLDLRRPAAMLLVSALLAWHAVDSWRIRPHYLAYFNAFAGGPENGWRHLVDSSLDWGQDLPAVQQWITAHAPGEKTFLSYFGTGDPGYEGIRSTLMPTVPEPARVRPWYPLTPGVFVISATMLQQVFSDYRGDWTIEREAEYQKLRPLEPQLLDYDRDPARRAELLREAPAENWTMAWKRYELLRFARLCYFLRARPADAEIGYSMLVYRLDAGEVQTATAGSLRELVTLMERRAR